MGAFIVNFHVRSDSPEQVVESLQRISIERAWLAESQGDWISFWEEQSSQQNTDRIQYIAQHVSQFLAKPVITFLVHDSDVLCYWLYDGGRQLDEYNSYPGYWGAEAVAEESLAADCTVFAKYCQPGTDPSQLEAILTQSSRAETVTPDFAFAEGRLAMLAPLLGLREILLMTDYRDIGRELRPAEIGAVWIGQVELPDQDSTPGDDEDDGSRSSMPPAPLHEAAAKNDISAIERLMAGGANINEIPHGYTVTALAMAASEGSAATIRKLVALGADLQKKGREGASPLRFAIQSGQPENIHTLAELGADVEEYDTQLGTLLHLAVLNRCSPGIIRALLEIGVDPERKNANGFTPLSAVQFQLKGHQQIQSMLGAAAVPALSEAIRELQEVERILSNRTE